ncbi:MAG TPA: glycyl-radical enzyme activating protein [Rectinemataceae bacterium]|nr:glycyl-radical enzyme activating protein [Rectinemataceae bacterium]
MSAGLVFDLRKFSIHDGPGIRTAVFFKGCPLHCLWCHNPEGIAPFPELLRRPERCVDCGACRKACPLGLDPARVAGASACYGGTGRGGSSGRGAREAAARGGYEAAARGGYEAAARGDACPDFGACAAACPAEALQLVGRRMSAAEVMGIVLRDRPFYEESGGGVTFTGGEPLAQGEFLLECLAICRAEGIRSAVDTSGWAAEELLLEVGRASDLILYDLKLMDSERHRAATGLPNELILSNLRALARQAKRGASAGIYLRLPVIPGINDLPGDLEAAAEFAASLELPMKAYLLPYHDSARGKYRLRGEAYPLELVSPPAPERLDAAAALFEARGVPASIGG